MKRSVNFNGFQPKHRTKYNTAQDFVNTCRAIGMTDDEIRAAVWKSQGKCIKCGEPAYQRNGKTYALCAVHGLEAIYTAIASVPPDEAAMAAMIDEYNDEYLEGHLK